jgi:long-chain acyl-CoA synthetase
MGSGIVSSQRPLTEPEAATLADANLAQIFQDRSRAYAERIRWRERYKGKWQQATWRENQRTVNDAIAGLAALGVRKGDTVAILSGTRWEWMAADWAIMGVGGVTVTIFPTCVPATVAYILRDADVAYVFVEDYKQYEKLLLVREQIPQVRRIILFEDAEHAEDDPRVLSFAALLREGGRSPEEADVFAAERAAAITPDDRAALIYTSGTTGQPKGAVHTHRTMLAQVVGAHAMLYTILPGMRDLLFLPLAHSMPHAEHLLGVYTGMETIVAPSLLRLVDDLRQVRPELFLGVPRVYEKFYAAARSRGESGPALQRRIFRWAVAVGEEVVRRRQRHVPVSPLLRAQYALADRLAFRKVREALGGNLQLAVTGAAPLEPGVLEFFHAAGIMLLEGWGLTETGGGFTLNTVDSFRLGTVGTPFPGHELRLAEDDEILVRGPCVFVGYHNNPQATAEAIDAEGWFHTGDIGELDADGFLRIIDRKKDLIVTAGGKKVAPQYVENLLKSIPVVSQACVYGDRKPYLVALLTLDPQEVRAWAEREAIPFGSLPEVYGHRRLRDFLRSHVAEINTQLAGYEAVREFDILPEDFTVEDNTLTPSVKIRRNAIYDRYRERYEQLYRRIRSRSNGGDEAIP